MARIDLVREQLEPYSPTRRSGPPLVGHLPTFAADPIAWLNWHLSVSDDPEYRWAVLERAERYVRRMASAPAKGQRRTRILRNVLDARAGELSLDEAAGILGCSVEQVRRDLRAK